MSSRADPLPLGRALDGAPMTNLHVRFWLLAGLGIMLLFIVAGSSLLGMLVTIAFRIEPRGRSLDEISAPELSALRVRVTPA